MPSASFPSRRGAHWCCGTGFSLATWHAYGFAELEWIRLSCPVKLAISDVGVVLVSCVSAQLYMSRFDDMDVEIL